MTTPTTELSSASRPPHAETDLARWVCRGLLAVILIAGTAFVYKLVEFGKEAMTSELASFAVVPVVVYILVALGFTSLFIWAVLRGQFSDIEGPKYRLLEEEERHEHREG